MTQATDLGAIINQTRTSFRGRVNANIQAAVSFNSGNSEPSRTYANMIWFDTANWLVKLRDASNTSWAVIGEIGPPFKWTAIKTQSGNLSAATTSGTAVTITGIPSDAIAIDIVLIAIITNSTSNLELQLGTSGGLLTSGYAGVVEDMDNTVAYTTTRFGLAIGIPSTHVMIGTLRLFKVDTNRWSLQGQTSSIASPYTRNHVSNGTVVLPAALDRVALLSSAGAFTAGGYALRWYS